jgi:hypothetical protein
LKILLSEWVQNQTRDPRKSRNRTKWFCRWIVHMSTRTCVQRNHVWMTNYSTKFISVGGLYTTNGLLNTVKVCVFPLLNAMWNHTKITSWSFVMILFVWSTVWWSLVIFRVNWLPPVVALNSWTSWLWNINSSTFPSVSRILVFDEICFFVYMFSISFSINR